MIFGKDHLLYLGFRALRRTCLGVSPARRWQLRTVTDCYSEGLSSPPGGAGRSIQRSTISRKRVWLGSASPVRARSGDDVWSPSVTARAFVILDGRAGTSVLPVSVAMGRPPTPSSQEVLTLGGRWDAVGYAQ